VGTKVVATLDSDLKPDFVVSTVAAAAFTITDDDCAIWIGASTGLSKVESINALNNCLKHIRENGSETPTGVNESYAEVASTEKRDVNSAFDSAAVIPEEAKVGIWYGPDFQPHKGSSLSAIVQQLIQKYQETTQR